MDYRQVVTENRRIAILHILAGDPGYSVNDSVMQTALETIGHTASRDVIRGDFAWLAEQGLVRVDVVNAIIHVARLTERGAEVEAGRATVPGVKRPSPHD
ncbi:VpaChn25_0724 family phage protein [Shumkonia mesophila]|uniref:VpaChn25_0724 family phage protein n=1 Tax=Shumkonia mesophila TaxID=2838854 RepID=UPI0029347B1D|nr:ArsR family transcriptional regulator [Shumkonia mesophila]